MRKNLLVLLGALVASLAFASTASAAQLVFTNGNEAIPVPDNDSLEYSSTIKVAAPGVITRVQVDLSNFTHTRPADLDIMLETPSGQFIYLMSDQCGSDDILNNTFNFADDFTHDMGASSASCDFDGFRPGDNFADTDAWGTAPPGTVPVKTFAGLTGTNQTGAWSLHVADDTAGETGSIAGGWSIKLDTTPSNALRIPSAGSIGTLGPITKTISGPRRVITDVDVQLNGLSHSYGSDLDLGLESPAGTKVVFASDGCDYDPFRNVNLIFDDEAPTVYPYDNSPACGTNLQRFSPANYEEQEISFISGLTGNGAPFGKSLSAFDGQLANGNWKLYVNDDTGSDSGYIEGYDLAITLKGAKPLAPSDPKLKSKKSGKSKIKSTGRVTLAGEALTAGECAGSVKSTFLKKVVKKKGKKKVTTYKKVVAVKSNLTDKAGVCGFDISAKLDKKYSGKKLRLVTSYLGGEFIAPFTRTTNEKITKINFK